MDDRTGGGAMNSSAILAAMVALTTILAMADPFTGPVREDYPGACSAFYQELKPGNQTPPTPVTLS
jgi:hypothetical protein